MVTAGTFDNSAARSKLEASMAPMTESVYGHAASDLQENILVKNEMVSGALKYVTGITEFEEGRQDGYFLALAIKGVEGATIRTKVIGGYADEVEVTDGFCLYRITDPQRQRIALSFEKDADRVSYTLDLSGLTLKPKEN